MNFIKTNFKGIFICLAVAAPSWLLGKSYPLIGGAVIAMLAGMIISAFKSLDEGSKPGVKFVSKKVLQWAVVLLGFGLNLNVIFQTGKQSLPIIICTIATSLITAYFLHKLLKIETNTATLIGVGSSICGGSAIAAAAPVIEADDKEVAQAISVIFFFNVIAAVIFPVLGKAIGIDHASGEAFGIFAGTAVNDTSSVTAAASTWDSMWSLGSATLDKAVIVKLTRTLAIIPITLALSYLRLKKNRQVDNAETESFNLKKIFPMFILYFVATSIITTLAPSLGIPKEIFTPLKELSKFFIIMAMAAIGINSDIVKLIKTGGKSIILGMGCWGAITIVSLIMQKVMGLL